ncbi:MAG: Flp pilus assembly protein CpaB [Proteobacteria bacterium]|nr:MAG: Flp pilus assembly protein CpaB [Pseudomonadota bacterium]
MQNKAFTMSFIVAVLAVSMVYSYVSSTEESFKIKYGTEISVVVAKKDIRELEILDETNLTTASMPSTFKQPGTTKTIEDLRGSLAIAPIMKDEQITRSKVTQLGARTGLARQVAVGKRAVTINITDQSAVAKLLKPGDRVDVLANLDPTGGGNRLNMEIRTILQDVLILATGKYVNNTIPGILEKDPFNTNSKPVKVPLSEYMAYAHITLEVDPFQAQTIVFAEKNLQGVYLVLRNNDDNTKEDLTKTKMTDLMGRDGAGPAPAAANRAPGSGGR